MTDKKWRTEYIPAVLPVITQDMYEELGETDLMAWHDGPQWTQTAVDFLCELRNAARESGRLEVKESD